MRLLGQFQTYNFFIYEKISRKQKAQKHKNTKSTKSSKA